MKHFALKIKGRYKIKDLTPITGFFGLKTIKKGPETYNNFRRTKNSLSSFLEMDRKLFFTGINFAFFTNIF